MNLSQLYYFQRLAEVQHYTRAAEDLYITQPALSHAISSLEDELDCPLFQKDGRNVRLTEEGKIFKKHVDDGLDAIDRGIAELKRRHGKLSGGINIGALATVRSDYLPLAMKIFRDEQGPLIEFRVFQGETASLGQGLEKGLYDMIITGPQKKSDFVSKTLFHQRLAVAVNRDHPLARRESLRIEDLIGYNVATYRPGIAVGDALTAFLRSVNAPVDRLTLLRNYEDEIILGAVAIHEGLTSLTLVTSNLLPSAKLVVIPLEEPQARNFYPVTLSYRRKAFRSPAAQGFIEFLGSFKAPVFTYTGFADSR